MAKCHAAFESAARYEAQGDLKKGFDLLLRRAFPESENKSELLNKLIQSLRDYSQLARHENYPALHISRGEAEFTLITSLSLFSVISRRLAQAE